MAEVSLSQPVSGVGHASIEGRHTSVVGSFPSTHDSYDERYYYGAAYRDYDRQNPASKQRFYVGAIRRNASGAGAQRVLDIGCAFGRTLAALPGDWSKFGVDASSFAIAKASAEVRGATFIQAEMPPTDIGIFDVVTAFDVIEHVADVGAMLERIDAILSPRGAVIVVVPVYDGPLGGVVRHLDFDPTHVHKWARGQWISKMASRFEVVRWTGIYRYLTPLGYLHRPTNWFRDSAPAILIEAKKR
jgi:SAM-dependent methyltransferase